MNLKKTIADSLKVKDDASLSYSFTLNGFNVGFTVTPNCFKYQMELGEVKEFSTSNECFAEMLKDAGVECVMSEEAEEMLEGAMDSFNPYAVCIGQMEKSLGKKKSEFTADELKKLDDCIAEVKKKQADAGGLSKEEMEAAGKMSKEELLGKHDEYMEKWKTATPRSNKFYNKAIVYKELHKKMDSAEDIEIDMEGKKVKAKKFKSMEEANEFIKTNPKFKVATHQDPENNVYLTE